MGTKDISNFYEEWGPRWHRWRNNKNPHLQNISVHILDKHVDIIEVFVECGLYPNRSEAIRAYLMEGIKRDIASFDRLGKIVSKCEPRQKERKNAKDSRKSIILLKYMIIRKFINPEINRNKKIGEMFE